MRQRRLWKNTAPIELLSFGLLRSFGASNRVQNVADVDRKLRVVAGLMARLAAKSPRRYRQPLARPELGVAPNVCRFRNEQLTGGLLIAPAAFVSEASPLHSSPAKFAAGLPGSLAGRHQCAKATPDKVTI